MCVIIHALRKKHLKRSDVISAMKTNSSGFFMGHWPHDSKNQCDRKTVRTLNESEALDFFDSVPDNNTFVMHARIPSKGGVNLNNVHGWEEDGVIFCHNMTMSTLSPLMSAEKWSGTNSEYFFRKLFMPMHRGEHLADSELDACKMGDATKRLTSLLCGESNKFLFVMPDNSVIRAGKWDVIASCKRTMTEEKEFDEVIGESVSIEGKSVVKTKKVKRKIDIEREFVTVLASNTYFRNRSSYASLSDSNYTRSELSSGYGRFGKWNPDTRKFEYPSLMSSSGSVCGKRVSSSSDCDDDFPTTCYDDSLEEYRDLFSKHDSSKKVKKHGKVDKGDKPTKADKAADAANDMSMFLEWRSCTSSFKKPDILNEMDLDTSPVFNNLKMKTDGSKFLTGEDLSKVFNTMLRCIIYDNMRENEREILEETLKGRTIPESRLGLIVESSSEIRSQVIPDEFDHEIAEYVSSEIEDMYKKMTFDPCKRSFVLPSEVVSEAVSKFIRAFDDNVGKSQHRYATALDMANALDAKMTSLDIMMNISFDHNVKSNKDIEKYARAGMICGRKLKWIPPALILSADSLMISETNSWEKSKRQEEFVSMLNIFSDACVSDCASLDVLDRKYVEDVKNSGFDFSKKGSEEIFIPGYSGVESCCTEGSSKCALDASCLDEDGKNALGEPEEAEFGDSISTAGVDSVSPADTVVQAESDEDPPKDNSEAAR